MKNDALLQTIPFGSAIAVYGAGGMAEALLSHLAVHRRDVEVRFFIDSFRSGTFHGLAVLALDQWDPARPGCDLVIVASAFHAEIREALLARGVDNFFIFSDGVILDPPPDNALFPPNFIGVNDPWIRKHWNRLRKGYDEEPQYKEAIRIIGGHSMVSYEGLAALCDIVGHIDRTQTPGAFVECGVGRGGAAALMALMHLRSKRPRRELHLFDSFQGLPEPVGGKDDLAQLENALDTPGLCGEGRMVPLNVMAAGQEHARRAVLDLAGYDSERLHIHPGWFQDTVSAAVPAIGPIALLRLDGDLYESTAVCLEHLYPLVVTGGCVYIDDWCLAGCRKACREYIERMPSPPYVHVVDHCGRFWFKT